MNNGESIKKYNDLLISYLNQLVNSIDNNTANDAFFSDIALRLKQHLAMYNMDIANQGVKTMMSNAFKEYANILKKYFDSSNIHRINLSPENINLANEMNQVTANLANAVTNMNKITEYINLIDRIKGTLKSYFSQNYENYSSLEFEIEQILNEVIVGAFTTFTTKKIEDFTKMVLPDLYTIADSITYDIVTHNTVVDENINVNEERDAFISETMDLDIEEGFENGRVTLKVIDSDNKVTMYYGIEAMEKLTSYNQLFESSRPGKKADTSNWTYDISLKGHSMDNQNTDTNTSVNNNITFDNMVATPLVENNTNNLVDNNLSSPNTGNDDFSNLTSSNNSENLIKDFLANHENNPINNQSNDFGKLTDTTNNNEFGNLTNAVNDVSSNEFNNLVNEVNNNQPDNFTNLDTPSNIMNFFNGDTSNKSNNNDEIVFGDLTSPNTNNRLNNNEFSNLTNPVIEDNNNDNNSIDVTNNIQYDDDLKQVRQMVGMNEDGSSSYSGSFSFLPEYNNPNEERDEFIKRTTGIEIDEDTDHKGALYLKVIEPTGREQIYTGKEAVNMIKNFNKTYLEANPGKKVDTTLIDNFNEE